MRLPPIQSVSQTDTYMSGNVTIHEKAVVASGVILQAAPDCRIVIGEGVCIGMGVVISASGGNIEIVSGAVLGAGVLIVGFAKIGQNACIGASSTLMNISVDPMSIIPSGSLLGDTSRQVAIPPVAEFQEIPPSSPSPPNGYHVAPSEDLWQEEKKEIQNTTETTKEVNYANNEVEPEVETAEEVEVTPQPIVKSESSQPVVGQVYINQLLLKLFPEREAFKRSQDNL